MDNSLSIKINENDKKNFKLFKISSEFFSITNWEPYKIMVSSIRPTAVLAIKMTQYPSTYCCIPISNERDPAKKQKFTNTLNSHPDHVHPIEIEGKPNFLLIQNMFYLRKEFLGGPFKDISRNQIEITTDVDIILRKIINMDALLYTKAVEFVDRQLVYDMQIAYIQEKKSKK